jgi:hypothetical protein
MVFAMTTASRASVFASPPKLPDIALTRASGNVDRRLSAVTAKRGPGRFVPTALQAR